jgi:hypothetical protein
VKLWAVFDEINDGNFSGASTWLKQAATSAIHFNHFTPKGGKVDQYTKSDQVQRNLRIDVANAFLNLKTVFSMYNEHPHNKDLIYMARPLWQPQLIPAPIYLH